MSDLSLPVFGKRVEIEEDIIPAVKSLVKNLGIDGSLQDATYIILKPNYVISEGWHNGPTTSPLVIEAMIQYIQDLNDTAKIAVGEGGFTHETRQAFENN